MKDKLNQKLSVATLVLFVVSLLVYRNEHIQGTPAMADSEFLVGFDVDKVNKIIVKSKDGNSLVMVKEGPGFVLENHHSYPLNGEKINDLLYRVSSITVEEKISDKKEVHENYNLKEGSAPAQLTFYDGKGEKIVDFLVGDPFNNKGTTFRKTDQNTVFWTQDYLSFSTNKDDYLDKKIMKIDPQNIQSVAVNSQTDKFKIVKEGGKFVWQGPDQKKVKEDKLKTFFDGFSGPYFEEFYPSSDQKVRALRFDREIRVETADKGLYVIKGAAQDSKYYFSVSMEMEGVPHEVQLTQNDNEEKLRSVDSMLKIRDKVASFNQNHKRWVYVVNESSFQEMNKKIKDFF